MATKSTKKLSNDTDVQSEIEVLKARLAELQGTAPREKKEAVEEKKIQQDDYVPVMSLLPYNLNLSTKEGGQGNTKKFTKFGEVKKILYRDLVDIMEVHTSFLESGYFYIMNKAVIRQHGLDDVYSKILTKEKIDEILSTNSDECVELYKSANEKQQEVILELLIDKCRSNPAVLNLNIVDKISRESGVDIFKKAQEEAEVLKGIEELQAMRE